VTPQGVVAVARSSNGVRMRRKPKTRAKSVKCSISHIRYSNLRVLALKF
jgi:hypothetical protein